MGNDDKAAKLQKVVNLWTIYTDQDAEQQPMASFGRRPQDWGDPKWTYRVYTLSAPMLGYENECHCWYEGEIADYRHLEMFASLITKILLPGVDHPELCGRDYLGEDDFWVSSWGEMPPYFDAGDDG